MYNEYTAVALKTKIQLAKVLKGKQVRVIVLGSESDVKTTHEQALRLYDRMGGNLHAAVYRQTGEVVISGVTGGEDAPPELVYWGEG